MSGNIFYDLADPVICGMARGHPDITEAVLGGVIILENPANSPGHLRFGVSTVCNTTPSPPLLKATPCDQ